MPQLTKTAQMLKFFAQQYGHPGIPRKRLVKLAYMADVLARQYLGRPISDFVYVKDHYGPNARELPAITQELVAAEVAAEMCEHDGQYRTIRLRDVGRPVDYEFTPGENEILAYVATNYLSMSIDEFIDEVVKETDPFQVVSVPGERLPMDTLNNRKREEIGFDLENVIKAERQATDGQYKTLADFVSDLRASFTS